MNLYFVVEGEKTERIVYESWLQFFLPSLTQVGKPEDVVKNNYFLLASNGYPAIKNGWRNAISDAIDLKNFDYLILIVDSESETFQDKKNEFMTFPELTNLPRNTNFRVIVQHCCIETWFLANSDILLSEPKRPETCACKNFYDVTVHDPELMGKPITFPKSKAKYHYHTLQKYFQEIKERYSKSNPSITSTESYYRQLQHRNMTTSHIKSFSELDTLFEELKLAYESCVTHE